MEYITVKQAAEKWGVTARQVQSLCEKGKVDGAVRFGRTWAIHQDAEKPKNGRPKPNSRPSDSITSEILRRIVESFPYPMHLSLPDGTLVYANTAFINSTMVRKAESFYGKYNVFSETELEKWGMKEHVLKAFRGETVHTYDVKVPTMDLINKFGNCEELNMEAIYQNITSFPISDELNRLQYIATIFITSKQYHIKQEIMKGKEYLDSHWQDEFNMDAAAKTSNFSKAHFARLFKKYTSYTPHDYYLEVKINRIKEKLLDLNISISQTFSECGVNYNSHYVGIFKDKVGMTPSEYRKVNS